MATIIKIKNSSTIGNVPSSLERGELAINTRDGNLFYGDGTYVQQDFVFNDLGLKGNLTVDGNLTIDGNITAQQYIVSSSVTYMTQSFSSGSTIFGDSADDTHQFTGSLLVNGNSILDGNFTVEGNTYLNGSNIYLGNSIGDRISVNGTIITQIKTDSHITASGNISSSGDIFANNATIANQLTAAGIAYPTADGDNGDVLITDGAGNLSFTRTVVYANVKNVSGGTLAKGWPVHATASAGNASEVIAASASNADTMPATYILAQELDDEEEGLAILTGYINDVDTSQFEAGQVLYVGADGGYTNVKLTGSNLIQNLGIVAKSAVNGSGYVYGSGRSNDVPNISPGYAWVGNSDSVATAVATSSFVVTNANTASYVAAANIAQPFSTLEVDGPSNSHIEVGTYPIGYDTIEFSGFLITGSGLIVSGAMATNHHNFLKIGEMEIVDVKNAVSPNTMLIHNVDDFIITSGSDGGNIVGGNTLFRHQGNAFDIYQNGSSKISMNGTGDLSFSGTNITFSPTTATKMKATNTTATNTYILTAEGNPNSTPQSLQSINAQDFFKTVTGAVTASAVSASGTITAAEYVGLPSGLVSGSAQIDHDSTTNFSADEHFTQANITTVGTVTSGDVSAILPSGLVSGSATVTTEYNATGLSSAGEYQVGARLALNAYGTNPSATAGTIVSFGNTNVAAVGAQSSAAAAKGRITVVTDAADGDELILEGIVKMSTNTGWSTAKLGAAVYMSTTAGQVTTTAPSTSGDYVRIVGHVVSATNAVIYFNPENGWIEIA